MKENSEIIGLLQDKQRLEQELSGLFYGAVEVREASGKKYIYVHFRDDGMPTSRYVGEYSDELYNLVLRNNSRAKEIKKELRHVENALKELGYNDSSLSAKVQKNIDYARRHLAETIYEQAVLEGVATTFVDTESIIEGGRVSNMTADDVRKIVNLKHAWDFVLNKNVILCDSNFALLSEINKLVIEGFYYNAGKIRDVPVSIGGTSWRPELPIESAIREGLDEIYSRKDSDIDVAVNLLLFIMKKQIFIDGNKRTAVIFCNHYLIARGKGMLVIPAELTGRFKDLLIPFYEGKDETEMKKFLEKKCYRGL